MDGGRDVFRKYAAFIREVVQAEWSDAKIADVLGVTRADVCSIRRRLCLSEGSPSPTATPPRGEREERIEDSSRMLNGREPSGRNAPPDLQITHEHPGPLLDSLGSMDARTREITFLRGCGWSLAGIGRRLGLSRERVRQICDGAARRACGGKAKKGEEVRDMDIIGTLDALIAARKHELESLLTARRLLMAEVAPKAEKKGEGAKTQALVAALSLGPATTQEIMKRVEQSTSLKMPRGGTAGLLSYLKKRGVVRRDDESGQWSLCMKGES